MKLTQETKLSQEINVLRIAIVSSVIIGILLILFFFFGGMLSPKDTHASVVYDNTGADINFGGTGVTISYYPSGSNGRSEGDVVLYENVAILSGDTVDCYILTQSVSSGTTITNFDQNSSSGSGYTFNEQRFFSPFTSFPGGSSSGYGGSVTFSLQFIEGGTFSYNTSSNTPSGTEVTLLNVQINTYDIDGNGASYSNQSVEYGGFTSSEFGQSTNIAATYDTSTLLTSFRSVTNSNTTNAMADENRVRISYDSLSSFEIIIAGGGTCYSFLDFGVGESWASTPVSYYQISGSVYNDGNGLMDNTLGGTKLQKADGNNLYVNLVNSGDSVIASQMLGADGTYQFTTIEAGTYKVMLTDALLSLNSTSNSSNIPSGWVCVGEKLGTGSGSDGTADGVLENITISNASVDNANLSINKLPESNSESLSISSPAWNSLQILGRNGTPTITATDNEEGTLSNGYKVEITSLPSLGNILYYDGSPILFGDDGITVPSTANPYTINSYDTSKLGVLFVGLLTASTDFDYRFYDGSNSMDPSPATYGMAWTTPLPVEFINVEAILLTNNSVEVNWATASEVNNSRFEIQRKLQDESSYSKIGELKGAGNSSEIRNYTFIDESNNWTSDKAYYRIKQIDYDGKSSFSDAVFVKNSNAYELTVYPNPASEYFNVKVDTDEPLDLSILNGAGAVVYTEVLSGNARINTSDYAPGIYFVQLSTGHNLRTYKIQITK